jgi:hypothetical protein
MNRLIARTLGALALAAAVATSSTAALAATPSGNPGFALTKKKTTTTLVGLSPSLRSSALQQARSMPHASTLKGDGRTSQSNPETTDGYLDAFCGDDWFITWDETANGDPILGTFTLHCGGTSAPIG